MDLVEPHVGARIRVTGRFTFREAEGRSVEIEELEILRRSTDEPP